MSELTDYLDGMAARAFRYGTTDCATLMADWIVRCGWPDPMADRRGTYHDKKTYRAAIRSEGGMLASCRQRFSAMGLGPIDVPHEGDVAVVLAPVVDHGGRTMHLPAGAIVVSNGLSALLSCPRGIACVRLKILASWSVGHG